MARFKARLAAVSATLTLAAGALVATTTPASAAGNFSFDYRPDANGFYNIYVRNLDQNASAGVARWWPDPLAGNPGDTIVASDQLADGYGIETHLSTSPSRIATTRGHASPYYDIASGNLPENTQYWMFVCAVKGAEEHCSYSVAVRS